MADKTTHLWIVVPHANLGAIFVLYPPALGLGACFTAYNGIAELVLVLGPFTVRLLAGTAEGMSNRMKFGGPNGGR